MRRLFYLVMLSLLAFLSCNTTEPLPGKGSISLFAEDVSCTEAWIRIKTADISLPQSITIFKDDQVKQIITLAASDTLLYLDSLQCNKNYSFHGVAGQGNGTISSEGISVHTLDSTSHDFTWQSWTFGGGSSSEFWDVSVINENDIWAVGQIYITDSTGEETMYNAVHWDGIKWEPKKMVVNFRGNPIVMQLDRIFSFSSNDIWAVGSLPIHGDGNNWEVYDLRAKPGLESLSLSNGWGLNSSQMYFGGLGGSLVYYNGQSWQKLQSGTTLRINDIWGAEDKNSNKKSVYCALFDMILKIDENNNITRIDCQPEFYVGSVWCKNLNRIYASGGGISEYVNDKRKITKMFIENIAIVKIRGTDYNNIVGVGGGGYVVHFNGSSWQTYLTGNGAFTSVSVKDNIVAAVGWSDDNKALITIGKRN